jgi:hypothetical protein
VGFFSAVQIIGGGYAAESYDPFDARPKFDDPFETKRTRPAKQNRVNRKRAVRDPFDEAIAVVPKAASLEKAPAPRKGDTAFRQANFQNAPADIPPLLNTPSVSPLGTPSQPPEQAMEAEPPVAMLTPCRAAAEKPLAELGIGIEPPAGQFPTNHAAMCWDSVNSQTGPAAGLRCWSGFNYHWDATCLCHRPLYFEEINLERYGYGCGWCLQPAASAAHFFGTVPALPYLAAVDCPHECIYTLGHYRPGSCPPWRSHWPPCDPLAL